MWLFSYGAMGPHPFRNSLLTSLAIHLIALLLLAILSRAAGLGFGRGGTLVLVAETAEEFPQPEMLLVGEWVISLAAAEDRATEDVPIAPADGSAKEDLVSDLQEISSSRWC